MRGMLVVIFLPSRAYNEDYLHHKNEYRHFLDIGLVELMPIAFIEFLSNTKTCFTDIIDRWIFIGVIDIMQHWKKISVHIIIFAHA